MNPPPTAAVINPAVELQLDAGVVVTTKPPLRVAERLRLEAVEESRRHDSLYRRALAATDVLAAALALVIVVVGLAGSSLKPSAIIAPLSIVLAAKIAGIYEHDVLVVRRSTLDEVPALFQLATLFGLLAWLGDRLLTPAQLDRYDVAVLVLAFLALEAAGRAGARFVVRRATLPERCMLVGRASTWRKLRMSFRARTGAELVSHFQLRGRAGGRYEPLSVQLVDARGRLTDALVRDRIHRVIISVEDAGVDDTLDGILLLKDLGVKVSFVPQMPEVLGSAGDFEDFDGMPVLGVRSIGLSYSSGVIKRGFDIVVSATVLVILSPLLALTALAIKLGSQGPVFFRQERVGRDGRVFQMLKFRTMYAGADEQRSELAHLNETDGLFKIADDPRVTREGRALRRSSLDELPQLLNVLRGDMSLVGPRPLVPEEDMKVRGWARRRLDLMPGMTGHWQVLKATRVPLNEMVKIDYLYVANWSLWGDVKALLRTLPHVIGRRGL